MVIFAYCGKLFYSQNVCLASNQYADMMYMWGTLKK
jgi:hypothetical protein